HPDRAGSRPLRLLESQAHDPHPRVRIGPRRRWSARTWARAPDHAGATGQATFTGVKVTLESSAPCWVEARSDGATVMQQTLPAGRSATLHATKSLDLVLGNAGGVRLHVNGKRSEEHTSELQSRGH